MLLTSQLGGILRPEGLNFTVERNYKFREDIFKGGCTNGDPCNMKADSLSALSSEVTWKIYLIKFVEWAKEVSRHNVGSANCFPLAALNKTWIWKK